MDCLSDKLENLIILVLRRLKLLKEEGIKTVLINPNIATVQTTKGMADQVCFNWIVTVAALGAGGGVGTGGSGNTGIYGVTQQL